MKELCIAILIVLGVAVAAMAETGGGFRDIPWGAELTKLSGMGLEAVPVPKGVHSPVESFRRKSDELKIGEAVVEGISYNFLKGRFYSVTIDFSGYDNMLRVMDYCERQYGKNTGTMVKEMERFVSFDSPATGALVYYQFAMHAFFVRYGRLFVYSKVMDREIR
jgi:hypothetical protein